MFARFTDRARRTMALASQEAVRLQHAYVGTADVLLALMKTGDGVATTALRNLGLNVSRLCTEVEQLAQGSSDKAIRGKRPHTAHAKKAVEYAVEEARLRNHDYVGTGDVLLGLLRVSDGITAQVLRNLGLKPQDVQQEVLSLQTAGMEDERRD